MYMYISTHSLDKQFSLNNLMFCTYMMILTRALRNDSLSFLGAYDVAAFLPFVPGGGLGGDGEPLPFVASQVLLRRCFGFLPKPITIRKRNQTIKLHCSNQYSQLTSLRMCGFVVQLVGHCTRIAEVTGSNPVEALIFFRLLYSNCLNWKFTAKITYHLQ